MLKMLDLFSGIGGFSLAASWTGAIETVAFCEIEPYCQKVLHKHWPDVPIYPDIKQLRGEDIGSVDIVCGGFPCQPFSVAGKRRGKEDDRYLWPEMFRIIQETKPTWVVGENVANFVNMGLDDMVFDLEGEGFEVQPLIIPAAGVGAPHLRYRVWILANSYSNRRWQPDSGQPTYNKEWNNTPYQQTRRSELYEIIPSCENVADTDQQRLSPRGCNEQARWQVFGRYSDVPYADHEGLEIRDRSKGTPRPCIAPFETDWWAVEPNVGRVANGIPNRVDRIKGLGNAVVPYIPYQIFKLIVQIEQTS